MTAKVGQGQTKASRLMMLHRSHQRRLRPVIAVNNERPLRRFIISGLGCPLVKHSTASAMGSGINFPVALAYLGFTARASTLTGKQCWLYAVRLQQTVIV